MFELGLFCVILLAAGYWTAMWLMGRHDDVLHGKFVRAEDEPEAVAALPRPVPPPFPRRPAKVARAADNATRHVHSAALQSLLAAIQQDLKDVA